MTDTIEERAATPKADEWAERIAAQQRSGITVRQFCKEQGLTEGSFYAWRKRLQKKEAGAGNGGCAGAGHGDRRAAAHRRRSGRHYVAHGPGHFTGMIHLPASVRVYLCLTACDMRKSFDGLHALVREHLELDAFAGHLFVFASRRKDRVKILYWGVSRM
jgi:IS66 Orf2 like protein